MHLSEIGLLQICGLIVLENDMSEKNPQNRIMSMNRENNENFDSDVQDSTSKPCYA